MIFDRTYADVTSAQKIREEKIKRFVQLTEEEEEIMERGTITINTLNRIESKQNELKQTINEMGYFDTSTTNKEWEINDIFDAKEFQRIVANNALLRKAFFVFSNTPQNAAPKYIFSEINFLEKILYDIEMMATDIKNNYKICGNFSCGE